MMNTPSSREEMDPDLELALKLSLESMNDTESRGTTPGTSGLSRLSLASSANRKRPVDLNDRYPVPKKVAVSNDHDEDYLLALKLSEELNKPTVPAPVNDPEEDFALAMKLFEEDAPSVVPTPVYDIEDDFALAMKLSKENTPNDSVVEIIEDDENDDFRLATKLQNEFQSKITSWKPKVPVGLRNSQPSSSSDQSVINKYNDKSISVVDPSWEMIDPIPDIYALFAAFNKRFFWGKLDSVEVKWSPRMTQCAGVCSYSPRAGFCSVRLSQPLLKLRPRKDLVETMLHEMIHAFLFVTRNDRDRDGHGPRFHEHMNRINKESGAHITVYHSFHDEVKHYKKHWWKCNGPCQHRPPYYGMVKRSMNRAPGPNDIWWNDHRATCGGEYTKVKQPDDYVDKKQTKKDGSKAPVNVLDNYFYKPPATPGSNSSHQSSSSSSTPSNKPQNASSLTSPEVAQFKNYASSSLASNPPNSGNGANRGQKILSLVDLNVKKHATNSLVKSSSQGSKSPSKSKFVPVPGQKKVFQFINDNDWR